MLADAALLISAAPTYTVRVPTRATASIMAFDGFLVSFALGRVLA